MKSCSLGEGSGGGAVMEFGREGRSLVVSERRAPVEFSELAASTDLKDPPGNWLRDDALPRGAWRGPSAQPNARHRGHGTGMGPSLHGTLPSLALADKDLQSVAKVDVITDAENVKKLLKMGLGGPATSMLVHRVGKTLLIDSFDSPKTLVRLQEDDWPGLGAFFASVLSESRPGFPLAIKAAEMEERLMLSKFLHHSIAAVPRALVPAGASGPPHVPDSEQVLAPDPVPPPGAHTASYEREVLWTFEDITMLLGTNLPIFGCGTHPCVTLRLRDMEKPINVLTGMDYWLDQLMCNVPEVAMCYHLDGIVQKYEMVPTEDLPDLPGSSFDPGVVRSLAGNLLGFLKDKATKEGHTYWLFKAKDDEVVKLYDLSSICTSLGLSSAANPFTVPVGILMYRVGRSLLRDAAEGVGESPVSRGLFNSVYRLLNSALRLLPADEYPEVVGSVHYLLSSLYLGYGTNGCASGDEEEAGLGWELAEESWEESKAGQVHAAVSLDLLQRPQQESDSETSSPASKRPLPNSTNLDDCCKQALEHVIQGLDCAETKKGEPQVGEPIPMGYRGSGAEAEAAETTPRWQTEMRGVMLAQGAGAYMILSSAALKLGNLGRALRQASTALLCLEGVGAAVRLAGATADPAPSASVRRCQDLVRELSPALLAHVGDIFMLYAKGDPLRERAGLEREMGKEPHFRDALILGRARALLQCEDSACRFSWAVQVPEQSPETLPFLRAKECYEAAFKLLRRDKSGSIGVGKFLKFMIGSVGPSRPELLRKLGNALNELGMLQTKALTEALSSQLEVAEAERDAAPLEDLAASALGFFRDGIGKFREAEDWSNVALLLSNCGRIARIQSRQHLKPDEELSEAERRLIRRAIGYYEEALDVISGDSALRPGPKDAASGTGAVVTSELAGTFFTLASQLQERPPLSTATLPEVQREIRENFEAALRQYRVVLTDWAGSPLGPRALNRCFVIHYRLASLHHKALREREDASQRKAKQLKASCEREYASAAEAFARLSRLPSERSAALCLSFLRMEMERVALAEWELASVEGKAAGAWRERLLSGALELLASCGEVWRWVAEARAEEEDGEAAVGEAREAEVVGRLWLDRSQVIAKAWLALAKDTGLSAKEVERRKAVYKATLSPAPQPNRTPEPKALADVAHKLQSILHPKSIDSVVS